MEQPRSQAYFRKLVYYVMDLVLRLDRLLSDAFALSFLPTLESTRKRPSSPSRFPTSVSSSTIWLHVACRASAPASREPSPARCCAISASPPSSASSCLRRPSSPTPSPSARLSSCCRCCCRRCRQYPLLAASSVLNARGLRETPWRRSFSSRCRRRCRWWRARRRREIGRRSSRGKRRE